MHSAMIGQGALSQCRQIRATSPWLWRLREEARRVPNALTVSPPSERWAHPCVKSCARSARHQGRTVAGPAAATSISSAAARTLRALPISSPDGGRHRSAAVSSIYDGDLDIHLRARSDQFELQAIGAGARRSGIPWFPRHSGHAHETEALQAFETRGRKHP